MLNLSGSPDRTISRVATAAWLAAATAVAAQSTSPPIGTALPVPPTVSSAFVLSAVNDAATGEGAFSFAGHEVPPIIRVEPGAKIRILYRNQMSAHSTEMCVDGPCRNMSNLHFHGLHVSPNKPQDDVISMMSMPDESLRYTVDVPANQPPGLYWYHTHPHGESYQQALDGMSGAIVVEGIDRYVPEIRDMKEQILILRDVPLTPGNARSEILTRAANVSSAKCGEAAGPLERLFTVNGVLRPKISIAADEKQFWRIVNASPDLYADLTIDGSSMTVVALDGMPLGYHDPEHPTVVLQHVLLPPAGRVEAIVAGPKLQGSASLRSLCVDTGPDGDPNPEVVVADLDESHATATTPMAAHAKTKRGKPVSVRIPAAVLTEIEESESHFTVDFTEDEHGFYINGKRYSPADGPMTTVSTGSYVHWRVRNDTHEVHPFHIHQVHFLTYRKDGVRIENPEWLDTVNVKPQQTLDLIMDFTDPIIRGMSVFHCHLLKHEDKGMMAKILFQ